MFKNNSLERRKLREEQTAAAAASVEQRKAELRGFVDEFQTSVGGILDKVLNSSGEFERVAQAAHRDGADHRRPVRAVGRRLRDRIRARPLRGRRLR